MSIRGQSAARRPWVALALGTSITAMAMCLATPASAQCSPDPTVANGTTICTGSDTDGLNVSTYLTRILVTPGASVSPGDNGAAIVSSSDYDLIQVGGTVNGGTKPGIIVTTGSPYTAPCDAYAGATPNYGCFATPTVTVYPSGTTTVNVAAGGSVTGSQGILLQRSSGNPTGTASLQLTNEGTVSASAGPAIVADTGGVISINNLSTGSIGGVAGEIQSLVNSGTIDGGGQAAIAAGAGSFFVNNMGRIVSTNTTATVSGANITVSNDAVATIRNDGTGMAINATGTLYIGNNGTIVGGMASGGALTLTNSGTITGAVTISSNQASTIDTTQGTIDGNVTLGGGDDTLRAKYDVATGRIASITGTVDGGGGIDTIVLAVRADATLAAAVLPTNFERLGLELANSVTVTLAPTFTAGSGLQLTGDGTLINTAALVTSGPAIDSTFGGYLLVDNRGSITTTLSGQSRPAVAGRASVTNSGTISATGGGGVAASASLVNSGRIAATGLAATVTFGTLTNSGTIESTGGTGASITGQASYSESLNSGTITGATTGVVLSRGRLINSGSIAGGTTGVALGDSGTLVNSAGASVSGGIINTSYAAAVLNAGTINGNVDFISSNLSDFSNDIFVDNGGTVNGAIRLGGGDDLLVVDLAAPAGRPLAGATGGVDAGAGYDTLRYRVRADASAAIALTGGFEALAYELSNNAALTLTAARPVSTTIGLAGNGTVTLNGSVGTTDRTLIDGSVATVDQLTGGGIGPARALTIVNNGTLSAVSTQVYNYTSLSAINGGGGRVVNNGTINVVNPAGGYYPITAIANALQATNAGTISLTGGTGINAAVVTNSGTITDVAGSGGSGVTGVSTLTNSGVIRVDSTGVATDYSGGSVTNSGTIESRQGTAVNLNSYNTVLVNQAGGTVRGATNAVSIAGGTIVNRGAIIGNVASAFFGYSATYLGDGGTVTGDVRFGSGFDTFIQFGTAGTGVTGTVDGGGGTDTFGYALQTSGEVRLGGDARVINFENGLIQAAGANTIVSVTAAPTFTGDLYVGGSGAIVNKVALAGSVRTSQVEIAARLPDGVTTLGAFTNDGSIAGGVALSARRFTNTGQIGSATLSGTAVAVSGDAIGFVNSGQIVTNTNGSAVSLAGTSMVTAVNSGTITGGLRASTTAAGGTLSITNARGGTIAAGPSRTIAIEGSGAAMTLDNAGTITGSVVAFGSIVATLRNSGTITRNVAFDNGADRVENSGTIAGNVTLGAGDDTFVQRVGATLGGVVDAGSGADLLIVDATGNGTIDATKFRNFERAQQTGTGIATYAGTLDVRTLELLGGTLSVAAGQRFATNGTIAVTGGAAGVAITNDGTIAGSILLGNGGNIVNNGGAIAGTVTLGGGDDVYVERPNSSVFGTVDGGAGNDLYRVVLAGDRTSIGRRTGFERLALDGTGTMTFTLDQNFQSISLNGPALSLAFNGFTVGRIDGGAAATQLTLGGDSVVVALGSGDDTLSLSGPVAAGRYDGGAGSDRLRFLAAGGTTLTGTATGFETVSLLGGPLVIAGTLGSAGAPLAFGDGGQSLVVASGGTLAGAIDLGGGDDSFRLAAGGTFVGTISGGSGIDVAAIEVPVDRTFTGSLTEFEQLRLEGTGTLTMRGGTVSADRVDAAGSLVIAADASLATSQLTFGPRDNRLVITGGFRGSVDGGAGSDAIEISGGSVDAPVAFGNIANVEALRMSGGFATVSGAAALGGITLDGGRLVGLATSTISAPAIFVGPGATFGSAGIVNGNVTVAGILSPGASPGTMTVNGNVAIGGGSISLFEITPAVSDKLIVNGSVSIAANATLQLVASGSITPGTTLDLVVASGGITGSFTNVVKPATLFGFVVQQANRIQLLGQFLNDPSYSPQVRRSIDYVNGVLTGGRASPTLLAVVPQLASAGGVSQVASFNRLTPEPYAAAQQIEMENGLALADAGRGDGFATRGTSPRVFTFGSALSNWRTLDADLTRGTAAARTTSYGFLGGLGWGDAGGSIGGFVGYLHNDQRLGALGARTTAEGVIAGAHARLARGGFGLKATVAYDGGRARTRRVLPGGSAEGRYDLHGWTGDLTADYQLSVGRRWAVRPNVGVTFIRSDRANVAETGGSPFALRVAQGKRTAAFLDGGLLFASAPGQQSGIRPFLSLGARYQVSGRRSFALAALDGGDTSLLGEGATRARVLAIATVGAQAALSDRATVFGAATGESGNGDRRGNVRAGLRIGF